MAADDILLIAEYDGCHFEIHEGRGDGFYVRRFVGVSHRPTHDYLHDDVATAKRRASQEWGVPESAWVPVVRPPPAERAPASCWPWLWLGQVPAAVGIVWLAALFSRRADPGYLGLGYLVAWFTSAGGTLLSLIVTLCFSKSRCGHVGCLLAIAHALHLIVLLGLGALVMLAPRESHPRPGGGF
jgi:hypothetical protein